MHHNRINYIKYTLIYTNPMFFCLYFWTSQNTTVAPKSVSTHKKVYLFEQRFIYLLILFFIITTAIRIMKRAFYSAAQIFGRCIAAFSKRLVTSQGTKAFWAYKMESSLKATLDRAPIKPSVLNLIGWMDVGKLRNFSSSGLSITFVAFLLVNYKVRKVV